MKASCSVIFPRECERVAARKMHRQNARAMRGACSHARITRRAEKMSVRRAVFHGSRDGEAASQMHRQRGARRLPRAVRSHEAGAARRRGARRKRWREVVAQEAGEVARGRGHCSVMHDVVYILMLNLHYYLHGILRCMIFTSPGAFSCKCTFPFSSFKMLQARAHSARGPATFPYKMLYVMLCRYAKDDSITHRIILPRLSTPAVREYKWPRSPARSDMMMIATTAPTFPKASTRATSAPPCMLCHPPRACTASNSGMPCARHDGAAGAEWFI